MKQCKIKIPGGDRHLCSVHGWVATSEELKHAKEALAEALAEAQEKLLKFNESCYAGTMPQCSKKRVLTAKINYAREYLAELKATVKDHDMRARWRGF